MPSVETHDVVVLGSGIAGLAAALAAHEAGLHAVVLEKAETLGGTSSDSYGLIWIGDKPQRIPNGFSYLERLHITP